MAIYLVLVPFIARTWRATGDEPHYLLAAHSLVTDADFDLANNYQHLDYLAFYFSPEIDPQVRIHGRTGQQILNHYLGLPVLIAPAYALAGRLGVLTFQAVLGGILAALTFKLAVFISRDEKASLLATLFVALSPPLFMYAYLIYPELLAALLTTLVLYVILSRNRLSPGAVILITLSLLLLPWLNRRFVPLALVLALFAAWTWGRFFFFTTARRSAWPALLPLLAMLLSVGLLVWFNLQLNRPPRADFTAPPDITSVWLHLGRGIGWLLDQQRGLFIFAPLYILALWGGPLLIQASLRRRDSHWFVVVPFLLAWGMTAAAGGYWVPWELGPRYLVVGLPALAPLLALAWRTYARQKLWLGLAILVVAVSLVNSLLIIRYPELPYKSSLPRFYAEKIGLPLTKLLPDLAGYSRIVPPDGDTSGNPVVTEAGQPVWFAGTGPAVGLVQSNPLQELPAGRYHLTWPVRTDPGLPPDTELLRISIKFLGGGLLVNKIVTAADLPADGRYGSLQLSFTNPNPDRWRTPMLFHAVTTGEGNIWAREVIFLPDPVYAWLLPSLYLALLATAAIGWFYRFRPAGSEGGTSLPTGLGWWVLLVVGAGAVGYFLYQQNLNSRVYQAGDLRHFVGQALADPAATDGRAWLVDPLTDPPQKAIYGPFDFYGKGRYHVAFRVKLPEPVKADQEVARLQVSATAGFEPLFTQPLRAGHFSKPNFYHDFVLVIDNPRRQALSFDLEYLGRAALAVDQVTITRVRE
jgi:hypothetical protein